MKTLTTLEELQTEAGNFVRTLVPKEDSATLVTLTGELGAGKTSFTQGLAKELGVEEVVTSPTFVLMKTYDTKDSVFEKLIHIDAYRLEGEKSLSPLGLDSYLENLKNLIIVEWPEKVEGQLPKSDVEIILEVLPDNTRHITYG